MRISWHGGFSYVYCILLLIVGVILSLTIVGAIVGVPLAIIGLLLFFRGMF
ncbi:MAG: hypothetical protein OHK003_16990 [Anaerolineales bacterium]